MKTFLPSLVISLFGALSLAAQDDLLIGVPVDNSYSGQRFFYRVPYSAGCTLDITLRGGDGGTARTSGGCVQAGGDGATLSATFLIGEEEGRINRGGIISAIAGKAGVPVYLGSLSSHSSGGNSSAILYTNATDPFPDRFAISENLADADSKWVLLAVAGGGGGAYQGREPIFDNCVDNNGGGGGRTARAGQDGYGDNAAGGTGGNGGYAAPGIFGGSISGGGGAYSDSQFEEIPLQGISGRGLQGNALGWGYDDRDIDEDLDEFGYQNWGFSLGGFGDEKINGLGGGGGGGYSGGGGGTLYFGGGGGGSFVNDAAVSQQITAGASRPGGSTATHGNYSLLVDYNDPGPPTFTCPADNTVTLTTAQTGGFDFSGLYPYYNDWCTTDEDLTFTLRRAGTLNGFSACSFAGNQVNTDITVTDGDGNTTAVCQTVITYEDTWPPVCCGIPQTNCLPTATVTVSGDETLTLDPFTYGRGGAGCGVNSETITPATITCADAGVQTLTYNIRDIYGRSASCTTELTVSYQECNDLTMVLTSGSVLTIGPDELSADNCSNSGELVGGSVEVNCASFLNEKSWRWDGDGARRIEWPMASQYQFANQTTFTVEFWFRPNTALPAQFFGEPIFGKIASNATRTPFYFSTLFGTLYFTRDPGSNFSEDRVSASTGAALNENRWYHLAVEKHGLRIRVYVDGQQVLDLPDDCHFSTGSVANNGPIVLGGPAGFDYSLRGDYDELRVWNYPRGQSLIQEYMHKGLRGTEGGLVLYAQLDGDARDVSDYANHGSATGGTFVDTDLAITGAVLSRQVTLTDPATGSSCEANVRVVSNIETCADYLCDLRTPTITITDASCPGATDGTITVDPNCFDCVGTPEWSLNSADWQPAGTVTGLEAREYIIYTRDGGNTDCSLQLFPRALVEDEDTEAPELVCPTTIAPVYTDCAFLIPEIIPTLLLDNCDSAPVVSQSIPAESQYSWTSGVPVPITLHATDASGNRSASCVVTITPSDDEAPELTCPDQLDVLIYDLCVANAPDLSDYVTATDNGCTDRVIWQQSIAPYTVFDDVSHGDVIGLTVTATDWNNNESTCLVNLRAVDETAPIFETEQGVNTCPSSLVFSPQEDDDCLILNRLNESITVFECSDYQFTIVEGPAFGETFEYGDTEVRLRATDEVGLSSDCAFTVTVLETPECRALPVELLTFTGEVDGKHNLLEWTVANEEAFDRYIIERSVDGQTWRDLGAVAGAIQGQGAGKYTFTDEQPLLDTYYRLRMIDLDGTFTFSGVIHLERPDIAATIAVYPNPNNGHFTVNLPLADDETAILTIYDLSGRKLFRTTVSEQRYEQTTQLPAGIYLLSANLASGRVTRRVVVR